MEEILWVEKYRPRSIRETILPDRHKKTFQAMIEGGSIPNLLLVGSAGVGKTTIAKAMCDQLDCSFMVINGSLDGTKDTLRNEIRDFASTTSMHGGRKFVILDEADGLTHNMQPALRNFMEEFSSNCGFILTANRPHKIIPELHSRCTTIQFDIQSGERKDIMKKTARRLFSILDKEEIEYDEKTVVALVAKHFPDIRKTINDLQRYSVNGAIDSGILVNFDKILLNNVIELMKGKKFSEMRKFVAENDIDAQEIYDKLYEVAGDHFKPSSAAQLVVLLAKYQDMATRAPNQDITLCAALLEISATLEWK